MLRWPEKGGRGSLGKQLLDVCESFDLDRIARQFQEEHRGLLAGLPLEAYAGLDHKLGAVGGKTRSEGLPGAWSTTASITGSFHFSALQIEAARGLRVSSRPCHIAWNPAGEQRRLCCSR